MKGSLATVLLVLWVCVLPAARAQQLPECPLVTAEELGSTSVPSRNGIIALFFRDGESGIPLVQLFNFHIVCFHSGTTRNTYRGLSVVANYSCNDGPCPSAGIDGEMFQTQFDFECSLNPAIPADPPVWLQTSLGPPAVQTPPDANFLTPSRTDCGRCINPRSQNAAEGIDSITHCNPCDSSCTGQKLCFSLLSQDCCNFFNLDDQCVITCPPGQFPNENSECSDCCREFTCFEGTACRGDSIPGVERKGDCCAGQGLSFSDEQGQCFDCFSEAAFSGDGSEFFLAFFNNLFPGPFASRANVRLSVGSMEVGVGQEGVPFMVESREDEEEGRTGPGGTPTEVALDIDIRLTDVSDRDEGICVRSLDGQGLSVVALTDEYTSVETFKVLPCVFLPSQGYEYFVVSVQRPQEVEPPTDIEGMSAFAVVPSENQTLINITLTQRIDISAAPDLTTQIGSEVIEIGQPVAITLNRRQSLYISSVSDLSGSRVVTNKPVSFITGHECGNIPRNFGFCDQMAEQLPPTATWGYEFLTAPISSRNGVDVFKAISSLSSGSFSGSCFLPSGEVEQNISFPFVQAGLPVEFQVSSNGYCYFESTVPTLLMQFSTGTDVDNVSSADPFMVMVAPIQQYQNSFLLSTFRSRAFQGVDYLNIFVPTMGEVDRNEIFLDGNQVTELLGEDGWVEIRCPDRESTCGYAAQLKVSAQSHVLNHTNPSARFSVIAYWLAYRAGHGYVGGLSQRPIALPQVTFETAAVNVFENESSVGIDLMRSGRVFGQSIEVFIKSRDNTAIAGEDYIAFNSSIVFGPEELLKRVQIELAPDDVFPEDSKSFDIFLTASPGVYLSPTTIVTVTIVNDDPNIPVVNISFAETRLTVREGVGIVQFRLLKADDTSVPGGRGVVRVRLTTEDGSATGASFGQGDYQPLVEDVTFEASDTERTVTTTITDNEVLENVESFTAMIVALEGLFPVAVVMNRTVTVEIVDDDLVVVGFTQALFIISEVQRTVDVGVELLFGTADVSFDVIVSTVNDFDAVAGEDFEAVTTTLSFGRDFQDSQSVLITILDDNQIESSETIPLQLRIAEEFSSGSIQLIPDVAQVLIQDNDRLVIGLDGPSELRVEEGESVEVTVRVLEGSLAEDTEFLVGLSTISGTARAGADFEGIFNRRIDFNGGTTSQTDSIRTIEDDTFEEPETFFVLITLITLLSGPGMAEVDNRHSNITITIDDDDPQITGYQCFPLANCLGSPLPTRTLEDCCTTFGFSFQPEGDVNACQPCILIGFSQPVYTFRERGSPYTLAVNLSKGDSLSQSLSLSVTAMPLTASLSDFQVLTPEIILLSESPRAEVRVNLPQEPLDDNDDISVESFILLLNDELGLAPANVFFRQCIVNIEDTLIRIGFAQDSYTVQEGVVQGGVSLFVTSNGVNDNLIEVRVTLQPGTATLNDDYIGGQTTVTLQPGSTQQPLFISIVNDDVLEMAEQFTAQLSLVDSGAVITQSSTTVVINDNDLVVLEFDQPTYSVTEGEAVRVTVVRRGRSAVPRGFTVVGNTQDGSATAAGEDYFPLRIAPQLPVSTEDISVLVTIQTRADSLVEGEESFFVILSEPSEGARLGRSNAIVVIEDFAPSVGFEETSYTVDEGVTLEVCAVVTPPLCIGRNVFVQVFTLDGTATGSEDYVSTSASLTFSAEFSQNCVNIRIQNDSVLELAETFGLSLTADEGMTLEPDRTTVTIIDQSYYLHCGEGQVVEVCTVVVSGILDRDAIVQLSSVDDEAVASEDFVPTTEDLTFSASVTRVCRDVTSQDDTILEDDEDFTLTLTSSDGRVNLTPDETTVTIFDDDSVTIGFEQTIYTVTEGVDPAVELCAIVVGGTVLERTAVVSFATRDGSATSIAPIDYVNTAVDFTVGPGVSRRCVSVRIVNDNILETTEDFFSTLTTNDPDVLLGLDEARTVILEDTSDSVQVGFQPIQYNITETVGIVNLIIRKFTPSTLPVTVIFNTMDGTAVAPGDYISQSGVLVTFLPSEDTQIVPVAIIEGTDREPQEVFSGRLQVQAGDTTVDVTQDTATVRILDTSTNGLITCFTTPGTSPVDRNCGSTDGAFVTASIPECCLSENGQFFIDGTGCTPCIVFGWFDGTDITLNERSGTYQLEAGFIKGGAVQTFVTDQSLASFQIEIEERGAEEGVNGDFSVPDTTHVLFGQNPSPFPVQVLIRVDSVALEPAEEFALSLLPTNPSALQVLSEGIPGLIVIPETSVVIRDLENVSLRFTENRYSRVERERFIRPQLQLSTIIATNLIVEVIPLNLTYARSRMLLPESLDPVVTDPNFNPNTQTATSVADFSIMPVRVTFTSANSPETIEFDLEIIDDTILEGDQVFVLILEVIGDVDQSRLVSQRRDGLTSLGRILDDDIIPIGFEQEIYTVFEAFNATGDDIQIPVIKGNNQQSELQIDVIIFYTDGTAQRQTAGIPGDYVIAEPRIARLFPAGQQLINFGFELIQDRLLEESEDFSIELTSGAPRVVVGQDGGPFSRTSVIIIDDDELTIGWERSRTTVTESHGPLELCLIIRDVTEFDILTGFSVMLFVGTIRGTAADPGDYTELRTDSTFVFITDENRRVCINVMINNDDLLEEVESFSVQVVPGPDGLPDNLQLEPDLTSVEIQDNDCYLKRYLDGRRQGQRSRCKK